VQAHSNAITKLDKTGNDMIQHGHYEKDTIRKRLDRLHELWDRLFGMLDNKGLKLQQALKLLQFIRKCDEMLYWIRDKVKKTNLDFSLYKHLRADNFCVIRRFGHRFGACGGDAAKI
jgi:ubiquinone biosynthesis protein COQ9